MRRISRLLTRTMLVSLFAFAVVMLNLNLVQGQSRTPRCGLAYTNSEDMNRALDKIDAGMLCGAVSELVAKASSHLDLETVTDSNTVRINSRAYTQASGDSIGFQSRPNQTVATTGSVQGGQISPRCASGIACTTLIGLHVDTDLKGTAAGNVTDVRVLEVEMVSDVGSGRTISGDAAIFKTRNNISSTISGDAVIGITPPSEATAYTAFWKFPTAAANLAESTGSPASLPANTGYIRVKIGATYLKIPLYAN